MLTQHTDRLMPTLRRAVLGRQAAARTDGELVTAFVLTGEGEAFGELVRRHGPMVLGVCRRLIPDHATADDAFQAVFLVLARRAASVRPRERVGNYLYGVAYRTALKARSVLARRRSREKQVTAMPEPRTPSASHDWADLQPVIDEELARLPEKLRVAVVLCDLEGRPQREVAKHLSVPPATLATRLASARRRLAARLTRRGVTLSGGALAGLLGAHGAAPAVPYPLSSGVVRAAEALAAGGPVDALVSAQAVQLSDGVMQMMMLAKLKAVAVVAAVALALATGLGTGLVPAAAQDRTAPTAGGPANPPAGAAARPQDRHAPESKPDDATFLRRLSLDLRGTVPTPVETWFFVSDQDDEKRAKVIDWLTDDDAARAAVAKKLGVPVDRVRVVRAKVALAADGRFAAAEGADVTYATATKTFLNSIALSADGKSLAVNGPGKVVLLDPVAGKVDQNTVPQDGAVRIWDIPAQGFFRQPTNGDRLVFAGDERVLLTERYVDVLRVNRADGDGEFLKQVLTDARGSGPTALELKYFTEDKDPKKREKLLDTLLKEPAVQKKLGDTWKQKMLAHAPDRVARDVELFYFLSDGTNKLSVPPTRHLIVQPAKPPAPQPDKIEKLVGELLAAQKSDEAVLEAVTLATLSRLPTDAEKTLTLAVVGSAADRKAAWVAAAKALAAAEAKKADVIKARVVPVSPAKP